MGHIGTSKALGCCLDGVAMRRTRSIKNDDLLHGWTEVAGYLQTSVKSARRWERGDDLPIIRPRQIPKGPVFASKRALKAWLTGGIASAIIADNRLIVFDRKARILWAHEFPASLPRYTPDELEWRLRFIDLHGNGDRGVLLVAKCSASTAPDEVLYFSSDGILEWTITPKPDLHRVDGTNFEDAWAIRHLIVIPEVVGSAIYVAMANDASWGGCVLRIDADGRATLVFANSGFVERMCPIANSEDGLLIVCGENNDFDLAFAGLLGIRDSSSTSIPGERSVYRYADAPTETPRKFILFPKTELIEARDKPYGHARRLRQYQDRVIIEVETGGDGGYILYHFTEFLEPIFAFPSGSHEFFHRKLEATRAIGHPWLECPEMKKALVLRVWTRNSGWQIEEIPWRDNPWKDDSVN